MQLNKNRSRTIVKLISLTLVSGMLLSSGEVKAEDLDYLKKQAEHHNHMQKLTEMINNLQSDEYDEEYNNYCENDSITINGVDYLIKDLYIEYGYIGDEKVVYLIDYHNSSIDVLTGKTVDKNYKRRKVILLKFSNVFYNYYSNQDKELPEYVNEFDGGINFRVPETYFFRPKSSEGDKVK
jgi:hypothetical protein